MRRSIIAIRTGLGRGARAALVLAVAAIGLEMSPIRAQESSPIAFVDVNVLPMDGDRVLERHTVVVEDGVIAQVGPSNRLPVPDEAEVIDGSGLFLMPGLAEMHAHIPGANASRAAIEDIFFLYIANGITSIRGMLGAPNQLELREETASGELLGPTIYVGAPSLNGNSAPTPEAAEQLIRNHSAAGYDFQKIHPGVPVDAWDRMVAVSNEVGFTYSGHVPAAVGVHHAMETEMSTIDHLDGYVNAMLSDAMLARIQGGESVSLAEQLRSIDAGKMRALAQKTRDLGVWNVPTMYLWENFYAETNPDSMSALPEMQYVSAFQRQSWNNQKANRPEVSVEAGELLIQARREMLKALADEGAGILMGTDSPQMFNVPGYALHREIRVMEESGLTPFQILESGTRNVASYVGEDLGMDGNFGTVTEGNRADLVLLAGNPLEDLDHLTERVGVMVRGRWVPLEEIEEGLAALSAKHATTGS